MPRMVTEGMERRLMISRHTVVLPDAVPPLTPMMKAVAQQGQRTAEARWK